MISARQVFVALFCIAATLATTNWLAAVCQ